jgi:hypothetical protein
MRSRSVIAVLVFAAALALGALGDDERFRAVTPIVFDPFDSDLVAARWVNGAGCPTGATVNDGTTSSSFTDPACPTGDPRDEHNQGLLLVKTGPTPNDAAAIAELKGVKGISLTELGYDLRTNSHCGAGAPRFNVNTEDGVTHFVGCNSPPPVIASASQGWKRLRWTAAQLAAAFPPIAPTDTVRSISIVFDEGQDTDSALGPDNGAGLAVIDNIDVNGQLIGRGAEK